MAFSSSSSWRIEMPVRLALVAMLQVEVTDGNGDRADDLHH
jgi:hypothetical protein